MITHKCKYKSACLIEKDRNVVRTTFSPQCKTLAFSRLVFFSVRIVRAQNIYPALTL